VDEWIRGFLFRKVEKGLLNPCDWLWHSTLLPWVLVFRKAINQTSSSHTPAAATIKLPTSWGTFSAAFSAYLVRTPKFLWRYLCTSTLRSHLRLVLIRKNFQTLRPSPRSCWTPIVLLLTRTRLLAWWIRLDGVDVDSWCYGHFLSRLIVLVVAIPWPLKLFSLWSSLITENWLPVGWCTTYVMHTLP
jgi:hypothetical protein